MGRGVTSEECPKLEARVFERKIVVGGAEAVVSRDFKEVEKLQRKYGGREGVVRQVRKESTECRGDMSAAVLE